MTNQKKKFYNKTKQSFIILGSLLVPNEKIEAFKQHLIPILRELPFRSLNLLKQQLPTVFLKINKPLKFKDRCSKHWWYDILERNPDIRSIWEKIPRKEKRSNCKKEQGSEFSLLDFPQWSFSPFKFEKLGLIDFDSIEPEPKFQEIKQEPSSLSIETPQKTSLLNKEVHHFDLNERWKQFSISMKEIEAFINPWVPEDERKNEN